MAAKDKSPGSITKTADVMDDRINNISNVSKTINRMQKDVDQKISETREEVIKGSEVDAIHSSMNQTLGQLNNTIGALSSGIRTITVDTAKATKDAIQSYSRAISEDISFNKKSVVAMALARTTPIYGYFVAKFVESDVWKRAMSRMAQSVGRTMGAIVRPFKGGRPKEAGIPHMQAGGYIQQGGMAQLHRGETVTPAGGGPALQQLLEVQQKQLIYLRSVFGVVRYKKPGMWESFVHTMGAPLRLINKFRKTRGVYTGTLSSSKQPLINIAQNIATLYASLMWRLDNMTNIMVANAVANRDLAMHTIGKAYPEIRGVRTRQLVRPRVRKLLKSAIKWGPRLAGLTALLGGAPGAAAGIFGTMAAAGGIKRLARRREKQVAAGKRKGVGLLGFFGRERGLYKGIEEEGMISGGLRRMRQAWLPRRSELIGRRGGMGGAGAGLLGGPGGRSLTVSSTNPMQLAKLIALQIQARLGGRKGSRRPLWVAPLSNKKQLEYWLFSKTQDKAQTKYMKRVTDNTKKAADANKSLLERFKKFTFWRKLMGIFGGLWGIIKAPFKFLGGLFKGNWLKGLFGKGGLLGNLFGGSLRGLLTSPALWTAMGISGAALAGFGLWKWLSKKDPKFGNFKLMDVVNSLTPVTQAYEFVDSIWASFRENNGFQGIIEGAVSTWWEKQVGRAQRNFMRSFNIGRMIRNAIREKLGLKPELEEKEIIPGEVSLIEKQRLAEKSAKRPVSLVDAKNHLQNYITRKLGVSDVRQSSILALRVIAAAKAKDPSIISSLPRLENLADIEMSKPGFLPANFIRQDSIRGEVPSEATYKAEIEAKAKESMGKKVPSEATYQAEIEAKAEETTAATKKNTDAIDKNTAAMKDESDKTRKNHSATAISTTTSITQSISNSSNISAGGAGIMSAGPYWSRRVLEEGV